MSTVFSKIVKGELPCHKIAENDDFLAFLDIFPLQVGHTLIIPKVGLDYLFSHDDETLSKMMVFSKEVAAKIKKAYPCERIGVAVIGFDVPHAHMHLIPINKTEDMNFANAKLEIETEQFQEIAGRIASQ